MSDLTLLIAEQTRLQINGETNRCHTLDGYSQYFDLNCAGIRREDEALRRGGLKTILERRLAQQESVVWVDLGCGNTVALTDAKIYLESKGIDPSRLKTYGFDALPIDEEEIERHIRDFPEEYSPLLLEQHYRPVFQQEDISMVSFPEKADIVTVNEVLFWTEDPLKIIANALAQAKIDALCCFNRINNMLFSREPNSKYFDDSFFRYISDREGIPGCAIFHHPGSVIVLEKREDLSAYFPHFRLCRKNERGSLPGFKNQGFNHIYGPA